MRKFASGLTLVELMVTLAVLAIIAAIGYPMYTAQVQKARRADARAGVMELAMAEEREYGSWGGYTESNVAIAGITFADGAPTPDANSTFNDDVTRVANEYSNYYTFTITADDSTYTIRATPTGVQVNDAACTFYSVDQTGTKNATDVNLCW